MPDQPPFDPDDDADDKPKGGTEGVRLIKPDEAAEAVERGEAVKRRGTDRPKYGDRPESPDGPRPNLRFPLADSADPTLIVRPKVAPVDRPTADAASAPAAPEVARDDTAAIDLPTEATDEEAPGAVAPAGQAANEPPTMVAPLIDSPVVRPAPGRRPKPEPTIAEAVAAAPELDLSGTGSAATEPAGTMAAGAAPADTGAEPAGTATAGTATAGTEAASDPGPAGTTPSVGVQLPLEPPPIVTSEDLGQVPGAGEASSGPDEPMLSLPISESTEMPHWTEPATGEVPRVLIGDVDDEDEDARWSSFADQGPRWRDQASGEWDPDDTGVAHLIADPQEAEVALGALDTSERMSDEEFLNFDDLDVPQQDLPTARPRGSYDDPISIQSEPARPARPTAPGSARPAPASSRSNPATRRPVRRPASSGNDPTDGAPTGPPSGSGRDLPTAILVGVAIAVFSLIMFHLGPPFALALVFIVVVLAGAEFFTAVRRGGFRPATLLGLAAIAALPLACYWRGESAIALVLFLLTAFSALWFILGLGPNATANIGVTVLGTVYVGVFGSYAALMLKIPSQGVSILLVAVLAAVLYDVGGFFVGRRFGRTPLSAVSPNKTMEGLAGGMLASVLGTFVVAGLIDVGGFSLGQAIVFGVFCAFAAPLGDLAESVIKRDLGLKDMGSILPEHGGILDRFDALLFVLPAGYYVVRSLNLAGL